MAQAAVATVAVETGVVSEPLRTVVEVDLVVGLEEIAGTKNQLRLALESGAGNHVEDTIGSVTDVRGVASALYFDVVDVLGIDLCAKIVAMLVFRIWTPSISQIT